MSYKHLLAGLLIVIGLLSQAAGQDSSKMVPLPSRALSEQSFSEQYAKWKLAKYWTWSPASKYHTAVVQVTQDNRGGSGVLVFRYGDKQGLILTSNHVVESDSLVSYTWSNGFRSRGYVLSRDAAYDGAVCSCVVPDDAVVIPFNEELSPKPGEYVEICGFGGPDNELRHFWATVREDSNSSTLRTNAYLLNGDSGGPVIYKGCVIGISEGGNVRAKVGLVRNGVNWPIHYPALACGPGPIRRLFQRACPTCPPRYYRQVSPQVIVQPSQPQVIVSPPSSPPVRPIPPQLPDNNEFVPPPPTDPPVTSPVEPTQPEIPVPTDDIPISADLEARLSDLESRVDDNTVGILEQAQALRDMQAQLAKQDEALTAQTTTLQSMQESYAAVTAQMTEILELSKQNQVQINQVSVTLQNDREELLQQITNKLAEISSQQDAVKDKAVKDAVSEFADKVWIYYTSRDCPGCKPVDEKIQLLRQNGYPIVITYLTPQQASVSGVPKIYIPARDKEITGVSNCSTYLAGLLPR